MRHMKHGSWLPLEQANPAVAGLLSPPPTWMMLGASWGHPSAEDTGGDKPWDSAAG